MKGVILAGGLGTRLFPLTRITNKHLLPVYNKPMIYYPLQILVDAGITEIMLVTGGNHSGEFLRLLRNGKDFGLQSLSFAYQEGEGGIADALKLAEPFVKGEKVCVVLGDTIIENNVSAEKQRFERQEKGGMIMLKNVPDPERFGVPVFEGDRMVRIEEKPKQPKSNSPSLEFISMMGQCLNARANSNLPIVVNSRSLMSTIRICARER